MLSTLLLRPSVLTVVFACTSLARAAMAGSPSLRPGMPPEVRSLREETLKPEGYRDLAGRWRAYLDEHPSSAVAHVMLSRAMGYGHEGTVRERTALLQKAHDLDPSCPEALDGLSGTALGEGELSHGEARALAERAVEIAPSWPRPHFTLWSIAIVAGDVETAAAHARALVEKGGIPAPLLDFGYNLLASADGDAIIFTNGDNDTYPPVALQALHGTRTDVRVANLSMLNLLDYAILILGDGPLTEKEIRKVHSGWKDRYRETGQLFSVQLLGEVLRKVQAGESIRPVYLAVTVAPEATRYVDRKLRVEGLLWRVLPEAKEPGTDQDPEIDLTKTLRLFRRDFRLDSATDLGFPWANRSSVRRLMTNYPAVLRLAGTAAAERGDLEDFRFALDRAKAILAFHGEEGMVKTLREYQDEIDPGRSEPAG